MKSIYLMKAFIIALLYVASGLCLGGVGVNKVKKPAPQKRIVGGDDTTAPYERPYQVGLFLFYELDRGFCGGVLVTRSLVLTAGHCYRNIEDGEVEKYLVVLGAYNINLNNEVGTVRIETSEVVIHPDYDEVTLDNNLAMLILPYAVEISSRIRPINLLPSNQWDNLQAGEMAIVSGWGQSNTRLSLTPQLQKATMQVIRNVICNSYFGNLITDKMLCTSGHTEISTCRGDFGGPLTVLHNGVDTLIGVVSMTTNRDCGSGNMSLFVRVSHYMDWILEVIRDYGDSE